MVFTPLHVLQTDRERERRLDQLAARLERDHGALERSARIMNLPTWAGYCDAVLLDLRSLPGNLLPAHAGDLLAATARAHLLATLVDEGPADKDELKRRFHRDGRALCSIGARLLLEGGYIRHDPDSGLVSAHPQIGTGMADIEVHLLDRPRETQVQAVLQFAQRLFWQERDLTPANHRPPDTAAYLNALGRALEALGGGEHPDAGPAAPLRQNWLNAVNVR